MSNQRPVAIVGVGAVLPDAPDAQTFWQNIRTGWSSIREVPSDRWNPDYYYDPDPSVPDKTYSKIGAWVQGFKFDPLKLGFAMPPKVAAELEETQKWALVASHQALMDYGYPRRPLEPSRVAVILGNLMSGEKHYITGLRIRFPEYQAALEAAPAFRALPKETQAALVEGMRASIHARIPTSTEDTLPGELANVIAGRIANIFNFAGPNFITDAACASSLAAFQVAIDGLNNDHYDAVLTGGVDRNMGPDGFVKFCKIGALSPDGSRPYDEGANGFVMGEGAAIFLMKRLADAERDGDRIYAVIRGIGGSSDAKGKSITAPSPIGQQRAIERAWKNAGLSPATASLIEGHGTATRVGDVVEVGSLNTLFSEFNLPVGHIALGSVKSNVGHLKAAAGAVALLKTLYALHDRILPPSINFQRPNPQIDFAHSPFKVNNSVRPWEMPRDQVRRAGISSFGFGGTNFHVVIEEYIPGLLISHPSGFPGVELKPAGRDEPQRPSPAPLPVVTPVQAPIIQKEPEAAPLTETPAFYRGLLFLSAETPGELKQALVDMVTQARQGSLPASAWPSPGALRKPERLAMDYSDLADLIKRAEKTLKTMDAEAPNAWQSLAGQGIYRGHGEPGKVVFLFPGQGSQYANMLRDLCAVEPIAADTFREADQVMTPILGRPLTSYIFVDEDPTSLKEAEEALKNTVITQPAVLTANVALLRLMAKFGFKPDLVAGHSLGEYAALVAAGVLSFPEALEVVSNRGRAMAKVSLDDNGCMAAVSAPLPEIERILKTVEGYVVIANINSPVQSVIGGATAAVDAAIAAFTAANFQAVKIPVSHAFHTKIVAPASQPLREVISRMEIRQPQIPVIANVNGEQYPTRREEILDILGQQVASPVQFVHTMETLYANGARIFVEIGPKRVLNALAVDNLKDHSDVTMLATNHPRKGGLASFNEALAGLYAAGVIPQVETRQHPDGSQPVILATKTLQTPEAAPAAASQTSAQIPGGSPSNHEIKAFVLKEVAEKTGYPVEMLDLDLDLEADLGIDTVKQAELFLTLREHYAIPRPDDLRLSDYNTLAKVIGFIQSGLTGQTPTPQPKPDGKQPIVQTIEPLPAPQAVNGNDEVKQVVLAMVSEKTGYPIEMLDLDLDLEADLGIDTVKQAELFMALRERYAIPRPDDLRLSDYNTLAKVIRFFA
jgi:malonyl CoA-acyl carrier protein transacylase